MALFLLLTGSHAAGQSIWSDPFGTEGRTAVGPYLRWESSLPLPVVNAPVTTGELARNPSLQVAATLLKPLPVTALLDTVKTALRAVTRPREQITPPPNSPDQPSANGWPLKPGVT